MAAEGDDAAWCTPEKHRQLLEACGDALHEELRGADPCARFLIARKGVVEDAKKMILRHQRWREEECTWWPHSAVDHDEIGDLLHRRTTFVRGVDKQHRPVIYVQVRHHEASASREQLYRLVIFTIEEAVARAEQNPACRCKQFTAIVDCNEIGWSNLDSDGMKYIFRMLAANYPERLGMLYILNDGFLFRMLWKVVEAFIDARTSSKIVFLGGEDSYRPRLAADFEHDQLWTHYGGMMEYDYHPDHITTTPSAYVTVEKKRTAGTASGAGTPDATPTSPGVAAGGAGDGAGR